MGFEATFEKMVAKVLSSKKDLFAPLEVTFMPTARKARQKGSLRPDGRVTVRWQKKKQTFIAEMKARSAPKIVEEGLRALVQFSVNGIDRMIVLPYLSAAAVELIKNAGVSGMDLNGNYYIQSKNLLAIRLDQPNQYKDSQPIKAIYSGNSSMVGRFLLMKKKTFESVNEIYRGIGRFYGWGGNNAIALSTVSKVLKGLEDDLIIEKKRDSIRLLQADKLLDRLQEGYRPPKVTDELKLKLPKETEPWKLNEDSFYVFTGEASVQRYATTTEPTIYAMYTKDILRMVRANGIEKYQDERFPNLILRETSDTFVYFRDGAQSGNWASPIQTYLELSQLDKREREIASEIRKDIIGPFL